MSFFQQDRHLGQDVLAQHLEPVPPVLINPGGVLEGVPHVLGRSGAQPEPQRAHVPTLRARKVRSTEGFPTAQPACSDHADPARVALADPAEQFGGQGVLPTPPVPCTTNPAAPGASNSTGQRRCARRRPTNSPTSRANNPAGTRARAPAPAVGVGCAGAAESNTTAEPLRASTLTTDHSSNPASCWSRRSA